MALIQLTLGDTELPVVIDALERNAQACDVLGRMLGDLTDEQLRESERGSEQEYARRASILRATVAQMKVGVS